METVNDIDFDEMILKATGLVVVDFWASWCGPCKPQFAILESLEKENLGVKIFKMDADENQLTAKKFNVRGLPTIIFFRDGVEVSRKIGLTSLEKVKAAIQ